MGKTGVGHTRWATHGRPNKTNAHPHAGCTRDKNVIAAVHNGIIENFLEIKDMLISKGHDFKSETDTEIIPHLIEENLKKYVSQDGTDFLLAFNDTIKALKGTFAIVVIWDKEDKIYGARKTNPLVLGIGNNINFISSDIPGFRKYTDVFVPLEDEQIVEMSGDSLNIYDSNLEPVPIQQYSCTFTIDDISKHDYSHYMLKEINEQALVLEEISKKQSYIKELATRISDNIDRIKKVYFLGCGSSFHACMAAENMFERFIHIQSEALLSSEFRLSNGDVTFEDSMFIIVSQSGETLDTYISLNNMIASQERKGSKKSEMILLENYPFSSIERLLRKHYGGKMEMLSLAAGPEICVVATKTYTAQLYLLALLTLHICALLPDTKNRENIAEILEEAKNIPEKTLAVLKETSIFIRQLATKQRRNVMQRLMERITGKREDVCFTIGRGINLATAKEGALKLKEVTYASVEGMAGGELKHGSLAVVGSDTPVYIFFPPPADVNVWQSTFNNFMEVNARNAPIVSICSNSDKSTEVARLSASIIRIPDTHWIFNPILQVIPIQLLGYHLAILKGIDPDHPRNLAKTVTVE
jgi:glucosamine--fructose-6-phosphate aminotransferase (isomerizing)